VKLADIESPAAVDLLRELIAEVRGLRADLRQVRPALSSLTREDRERLAAILPAIAGALGSEPFTSRDVIEDEAPAVRVVRKGLTVKALSKLFVRGLDVPIDGLMIQKAGAEFGVVAWRVVVAV
jgi:hypothetical protein